jgi:hydroxymethylglutaryl-CoA reductase
MEISALGQYPLPPFRSLTVRERNECLRTHCHLTDAEVALLNGEPLSVSISENLIENSIGYFAMPMGIATNFQIDGKDRLIPMVVEETSIIAAASATAKWIKLNGCLTTEMRGQRIIGQMQIPRVTNPAWARVQLEENRTSLMAFANARLPGLVGRGGGVQDIEIRELTRRDGRGVMFVLHVLCDTCDAMGANLINQACESLKPLVEDLTGEKVGLCILSNLVDGKLATAELMIRDIEPDLADGICEAGLFAETDPYRAATHNKGVLNGIDPILIATGNDWRAVEAGAHAYAARSGSYQPLTTWRQSGDDLIGKIALPLAVGTVGGVTRIHPMAKISLKILGVEHANDLARICAAVGLVQNLGALKALSTVGIVRGHMELHASNLALAAGSTLDEIAEVRHRLSVMIKMKKSVGITVAEELLREIRSEQQRVVEDAKY